MIKTNVLKSIMALFGDTQESLANELHISVQNANAKINGTDGAEFTPSEIHVMKIRYNMTAEQVDYIFLSTNDTLEGISNECCNCQ